MARLVYSAITSLDGYVADVDGGFEWAAPDEEVHAFVNDLERPLGTYLYGRRMYDTMVFWETVALDVGVRSPAMRDFARIWRAADKVVYSRTLADVSSARTRLERSFDVDAVRELIRSASRDVSIGGPALAAEAVRAGLVDDLHVLMHPIVVGGGTAWLPDGLRLQLELLDQRRFDCGVVHVHYRTRATAG